MPEQPLVSIIIPTYNRAHLIGETLDSVLAQTYTNWECIVVDDGSTDNTDHLINQYAQKDQRFRYFKRPSDKQKGANACRNFGLNQSKGEFINFFDSDDVMDPDKLLIQVRTLLKHAEAPFCICQTKWIDKKTNEFLGLRSKYILSAQPLEDYILFKVFWSVLAPLWRSEFLKQNELFFDDSLAQSQEYDFHIKALSINSNYVAIDNVLATMYRHSNNISNNLYESKTKLESNIMVKERILKLYRHRLTSEGMIKLYEMLTLMFKDLLKYRHFELALRIMKVHFAYIKCLQLPFRKKMIFLLRMTVMYVSYGLFNRGYNMVKPLK